MMALSSMAMSSRVCWTKMEAVRPGGGTGQHVAAVGGADGVALGAQEGDVADDDLARDAQLRAQAGGGQGPARGREAVEDLLTAYPGRPWAVLSSRALSGSWCGRPAVAGAGTVAVSLCVVGAAGRASGGACAAVTGALAVGGLRAGGLAAAGWWADGGGDTRKAGVTQPRFAGLVPRVGAGVLRAGRRCCG